VVVAAVASRDSTLTNFGTQPRKARDAYVLPVRYELGCTGEVSSAADGDDAVQLLGISGLADVSTVCV
jgi:hypothetical protein